VNPLLLPGSLVKRALDDLSAIADAARRLTSLESGVLGGLSRVESQLDALRGELAPIQELSSVREAVEPLRGQLDGLHGEIAALREEAKPIAEHLDGRIETLREDLSPLGELADKVPGIGRR
jgi:hypothetical protein